MIRKLIVPSVALAFLVHAAERGLAFNTATHVLMTQAAGTSSSLNTSLKTDLQFPNGVNQTIQGFTILRWLGFGAEHEDDGSAADFFDLGARSYRHFHDPTQPWNNAGLQIALFPPLESSVLWMQEDDGSDAGSGQQKWSWPDARRSYRDALTSRLAGDRDQRWADTFRAVGEIMHLVEDAAQPAHVRNDPHALEYICQEYFKTSKCGGNFEYWVSAPENAGSYSYDGAPPLDLGMLHEATNDTRAPVPVARLIDNDIYIGGSANVTLGPLDENNTETMTAPVGIAEFTNANFFSEDTAGVYPHPDVSLLVDSTAVANNGVLRRYLKKGDGDGMPVDPALVDSVFGRPLRNVPFLSGFYAATLASQDEKVWAVEAAT